MKQPEELKKKRQLARLWEVRLWVEGHTDATQAVKPRFGHHPVAIDCVEPLRGVA